MPTLTDRQANLALEMAFLVNLVAEAEAGMWDLLDDIDSDSDSDSDKSSSGRWSSLRGLRCAVDNTKGLHFASLWVTTCIHLHAFAMDHEDGIHISTDQFFKQGVQLMRKERRVRAEWLAVREEVAGHAERRADEDKEIELLEGKVRREDLKRELFAHIDRML